MDISSLKDRYRRKGVVVLRDYLSEEWISRGTNAVESVHSRPSALAQTFPYRYGEGNYFRDFGNWKGQPDLQALVFESPLARLVSEIIGTNSLTFYHDQCIVKDPRNMSLVGFQQRMSNYPFEGTQGCTVYITLDPVPLETALKVVVGSHLWNKTFFPDGFNPAAISDQIKEGQYERIPDIRALHEAMIRETNLFPGDVVLYNMKCIVSTNGNATHHPQRALALHFFGDDVKFEERPWPINPPITGDLKVGDHPSKDSTTFPTAFTAANTRETSTSQPAHALHKQNPY